MGDLRQVQLKSLWVGRSPLRVIGNLLLAWLGLLVMVLIGTFPIYPDTTTQWLWMLAGGPPALFVLLAGTEWIGTRVSTWTRGKSPELRIWESIFIVLVLLALVAWGIHSTP